MPTPTQYTSGYPEDGHSRAAHAAELGRHTARPSRRVFVGGSLWAAASVATIGSQLLGTPANAAVAPPAAAVPAAPAAAHPARQTKFTIRLGAITALQLTWWFQHLADEGGKYWKVLAPGHNRHIEWAVNPREDAHQQIGSIFASEQRVAGGLFRDDTLSMLVLFADYITQPRGWVPGQPAALNPPLGFPSDYTAPYPSPPAQNFGPITPDSNGFNHDMVLLDGHGFAPGRMLWSWRDTGSDDMPATGGKPASVDLTVTFYQPWMEGANRPPALDRDGYYYSDAQVTAIWAAWAATLSGLTRRLPRWYNIDTQDDIARGTGWTVTSVIDTGEVDGVDSKMWVWWWNHAMGDAPGTAYTLWCPPAHYSIRWLPGYSPADVLGSKKIPSDHVVYGCVYPDLQGGSLVQDGGGMMSYPPSMSPIPGRYKVINPMFPVSKAQVDNFANDRFPVPPAWLLHQWEDTSQGVVHRSTGLGRLPLRAPVTQQGFYFEHQMLEGQNWGHQSMKKAYRKWLRARNEHGRH